MYVVQSKYGAIAYRAKGHGGSEIWIMWGKYGWGSVEMIDEEGWYWALRGK